jgi:hypothetical protein
VCNRVVLIGHEALPARAVFVTLRDGDMWSVTVVHCSELPPAGYEQVLTRI